MYIRVGCFSIATLFCLFVSGMLGGEEVARAAVVKVTPANVQAAIDALPDGTPESLKPKSLQAIVEDSATYVGDEDALDFAPGTYDDIGELILKRPLTLRKDPSMEGDVVITGELLIHIRSKGVKVEDMTFRNLEIEKFTLLGRGESTSSRTGPIEVYLSEVTLPSFLLARKAASKTATDPDRNHNYSSYTGQLTLQELEKHIGTGGVHPSGWLYTGIRVLSNEKGFPMARDGRVASYSGGKWHIHRGPDQETIGGSAAHILINPRYFGAAASCPDSENFAGIEITRNSFDGTEMTAILSLRSWDATGDVPQGSKGNCFVEVDITGNTFRNIGIADYAFLTDSDGNFITDGDGKRIPDNYGDLSKYAIGLFSLVRKATISDNTIEGTTHNPIVIRDTPEGGRVAVRNNLIRPAPDEGARFPRFAETQIDIRGSADDVEITITGNRLLGSDDFYPYFISRFDLFRGRAGWCQDPVVPGTATIAQLETLLQPRIWRSYVPDFPYPGGEQRRFFMPFEGGRPAELSDLLTGFSGNNAQVQTDVVISNWDVVRHKRCHPTSRIEIRGQDGVSIVGNDLGYVAGDDSGESYVSYGITLWRFRGSDPTLAEFTGNNIDYFLKGAVEFFGGNAETSLSTRGNYLGPEALVPGTVNRVGELGEPVVREDAIGPQEKDPPTVPATGGAMISETGTVIVLTYDEMLDDTSVPAVGAFTVMETDSEGLSGSIKVIDVSVSGMSVMLTLERSPGSGNSVTVSYDPANAGSGTGRGPIRDIAGNVALALTSRTVTAASMPPDSGPGPAGPMGPGEPQQPVTGGGDGGCALASGGSDGADLGVLLLAVFVFLGLRRDTRKER